LLSAPSRRPAPWRLAILGGMGPVVLPASPLSGGLLAPNHSSPRCRISMARTAEDQPSCWYRRGPKILVLPQSPTSQPTGWFSVETILATPAYRPHLAWASTLVLLLLKWPISSRRRIACATLPWP